VTTEQWQASDLVRPDVAALEPYTPIQPFEVLSKRLGLDPSAIVKLDANENPYGPVPAVSEALAEYAHYHIYPDPEQTELRTELGAYLGVPFDSILATHGADEILDVLCRLFLEPGDSVVNCPPTFGMYRFDARVNGAAVIDVWRDQSFEVDVAAVADAVERSQGKVKIVFLASPNNPSGNWLADDELLGLLGLPAMVVVDEAYVEFAQRASRVTWVADHANLVVVRTFSKVAGMAGLRLGYSVCPQWLMPYLWKFKQPYNVNVAATVAGLASLRSRSEIEAVAATICSERDRLFGLLKEVPYLEPWPSSANFLLCKAIGIPAADLKRALERKGIMVRYYSSPGLEDCIRISVGRPDQTDRLMAALYELA
jgi:histidinol-phosphate aminotransferase